MLDMPEASSCHEIPRAPERRRVSLCGSQGTAYPEPFDRTSHGIGRSPPPTWRALVPIFQGT